MTLTKRNMKARIRMLHPNPTDANSGFIIKGFCEGEVVSDGNFSLLLRSMTDNDDSSY